MISSYPLPDHFAGIDVHLSSREVRFCKDVAFKRHADAMARHRGDFMRHDVEDSLTRHTRGLCEGAVAKATGYKWWAFVNNVDNRLTQTHNDVGPLEVRENADGKDLFIKNKEPLDSTPYVLVHRLDFGVGCYRIVGWKFGFEVQPKHWSKWLPDPAYLVPATELAGVESLWNWCIEAGHGQWATTLLRDVEIINESLADR